MNTFENYAICAFQLITTFVIIAATFGGLALSIGGSL